MFLDRKRIVAMFTKEVVLYSGFLGEAQ